jgi:hypothetical protein
VSAFDPVDGEPRCANRLIRFWTSGTGHSLLGARPCPALPFACCLCSSCCSAGSTMLRRRWRA